MHGDKGALEGVVEGVEGRVRDGTAADGVEALAEVGMPQFVAARQGLEGALIDHGASPEWCGGSGDKVAPPKLQAEGVAEDLLLVG